MRGKSVEVHGVFYGVQFKNISSGFKVDHVAKRIYINGYLEPREIASSIGQAIAYAEIFEAFGEFPEWAGKAAKLGGRVTLALHDSIQAEPSSWMPLVQSMDAV